MKRKITAIIAICLGLIITGCGQRQQVPEKLLDDAPDIKYAPVENLLEVIRQETLPEIQQLADEKKDSNLIFEDEFNGVFMDSDKWEHCPETQRQGWLDVWDDDMAYLDEKGNLVLRAEWDKKNYRITSGAVWTKGLFECDFGYYEASIKLPDAPGIWGAFWMMSGDVMNINGTASDGVEIDIIESIEADSGRYQHAIHWDGYADDHPRIAHIMDEINIYDGEFHTFGLLRTKEEYVFYIDGTETWRLTEADTDVCYAPGHLLLSVEGADWVGAGTWESINALPAEMRVDYVRVYKEFPY